MCTRPTLTNFVLAARYLRLRFRNQVNSASTSILREAEAAEMTEQKIPAGMQTVEIEAMFMGWAAEVVSQLANSRESVVRRGPGSKHFKNRIDDVTKKGKDKSGACEKKVRHLCS
jgi:hypothetical protein